MELPICPCNSGLPYEECCYKKVGPDGERLFFQGTMFGGENNTWHPRPNTKIFAIISGKSTNKYRDFGKDLASRSKLSNEHHSDFIDIFAMFFSSYERLLTVLQKSQGKGVIFELDTLEARESWKQFLFNGRILLDFLGVYCRGTLGLKEKVEGLSAKKLESLFKVLEKQGRSEPKLLQVKAKIEAISPEIIKFIALRDREKIHGDTIIKFPATNEVGTVYDGELQVDGETFPLIKYSQTAYEDILKLTKILIRIDEA